MADEIECDIDSGGNDSGEDDEERIPDVPMNYQSIADEEKEEVRVKVSKYVQLKKKIQPSEDKRDEGHNEDKGEGEPVDNVECLAENQRPPSEVKGEKVGGFESDQFDLSDLGSNISTSSGSDADDAQRTKSSRKNYDPNVLLEEIFLDLRFPDLKLFKNVLVEYSTRYTPLEKDLSLSTLRMMQKG